MPRRQRILLPFLALAGFLAFAGAGTAADLMTVCAPEIQKYSTDVSKGRGRVSACLLGRMDKLSAACKPEVLAVRQSRATPDYARKVFDPAFRAPLPQACVASAKSLCAAVPTGDGRAFACLYARSDRVPKACAESAQAELKQMK